MEIMLRLLKSVPQKAPNNLQDSKLWVNAFLSDLCNMIWLTEICHVFVKQKLINL